jgi:hypothetical protein
MELPWPAPRVPGDKSLVGFKVHAVDGDVDMAALRRVLAATADLGAPDRAAHANAAPPLPAAARRFAASPQPGRPAVRARLALRRVLREQLTAAV